MLRVSLVEKALEDIGWGAYHTKLFFNCSFVSSIIGLVRCLYVGPGNILTA